MRGDKLRLVLINHLLGSSILLAALSQPDQAQSIVPAKLEPTGATLLSVNSPTKDEDPNVLTARDGTIFVTWFSDRGDNPDIYLTSTNDGINWRPTIRVTT